LTSQPRRVGGLTLAEWKAVTRIARTDPRAAWGQVVIRRAPGVELRGGVWTSLPPRIAVGGQGRIVVGDGLFCPGTVELQARDSGRVAIGEKCSIEQGARLAAANDAALTVGDYVGIGPYNFLSAFGADLTVGAWTMFGPHVSVHTVDHGTRRGEPMRLQPGVAGAVEIGEDVWIGAGAVVVKGVCIGEGAVVAAGAVVTRDVDPYMIVAGVPARPIGHR
jgi:acetyltransferase-like isoleucine patch superfamily enzyme